MRSPTLTLTATLSDDGEYEEYYAIPDGEVQALEMDQEAQRNMCDILEKEEEGR